MQGNAPSSLSRALENVQRQLKSGKTRKGIDLDKIPGKRKKLEEEKAAILDKMQKAKDKHHDERMAAIKEHTTEVGDKTTQDVNKHTTSETDRMILAVESLVPVKMKPKQGQVRMAAELAGPLTGVSVLNSILRDEGLECKGTKTDKAELLVERIPVDRLVQLVEEHKGMIISAKPKAEPKAKAKAKASQPSKKKSDKDDDQSPPKRRSVMSMLVQPPKPASEQPPKPESDSNGDSSSGETMPDITDVEVTSASVPLGGRSDSDSDNDNDSDSEVET